jgi:hypothetical protein
VIREGCKARGHPRRGAAARGEQRRGKILTGVDRRGGDDEANMWGPCDGDRGRRRRHRAAQTRRRDGFWQIRQCRASRDGPSTHAWPAGEKGGPVGLAGLRGRVGRLAAGPIGPNAEEKFFSNKNWIFEFTKALEICRRRFRRNFDMRISPKFF